MYDLPSKLSNFFLITDAKNLTLYWQEFSVGFALLKVSLYSFLLTFYWWSKFYLLDY